MITVGLTGMMCSGKSEVLKYFKELGCITYSADNIVRRLLYRGQPGFKKVAARYGKAVLNSRGSLDRNKLRQTVLNNRKELLFLEKTLHPMVRSYIREKKHLYRNSSKVLVAEIPLLFETGFNREADVTVCLKTSDEKRKEFARKRGLSWQSVRALSQRQWPSAKKAAAADYIILNKGNLKQLRSAVRQCLARIENGGQ